jgi:integrase
MKHDGIPKAAVHGLSTKQGVRHMGELLAFTPPARKRLETVKIALTDQRIKKLTREGFHWDSKADGLAVRVTKAGAKTFVFRRQVHGALINIALGPTSMTVDDARKAVLQYNGAIAGGRDIRAEKRAERAKAKPLTLGDAFDSFKTSKARRPSTLTDYEFLWRDHIPGGLKRKAVTDILTNDVEAAKVAVMRKGRTRTAAKVVVLLSTLLRFAGRRFDNPAADVSRPEMVRRTRRLNRDELAAVFAVLTANRGEFWSDFLSIALMTGARRGALQAMRWADLHLDDNLWLVPATWSKNGHELAIALPGPTVQILRARQATASSPWVWPSPNSASGHVVEPRKALAKLLRDAGVTTKISPHDLRRTVGSRLAMTGANAATISAALGHLSADSAKAYVHLTTEPVKEAIEKAMGL